MFKSLIDLGSDVVKTVAAPVEIAADISRALTKPVADSAQELVKDVKESTQEITKEGAL